MMDGKLIELTLSLTRKGNKTEKEEKLLRLLMDGASESMSADELSSEIDRLVEDIKVGQTTIMSAITTPPETEKKPKDMIFMAKTPEKGSRFVVHLHVNSRLSKIPHSEDRFIELVNKRVANSRTPNVPVLIKLVSDDMGESFFFSFELIALDSHEAETIISKQLQIYMPSQYELQSLKVFTSS